MLTRALLMLAMAAAAATGRLSAQNGSADADRLAVRRAVLDYVEGFYEGDSTKILRSIHPEFYKYGFFRRNDTASYAGSQMTWEAALAYVRRMKASDRPTPATAPKQVELLDVADQTAAAKLTAWWGIDYVLLGKYDGKWMISHVLWQSPPRKAS